MAYQICPMKAEDYPQVMALWQSSEGVGLSQDGADSYEGIARYLARNPGCSFTVWDDDKLIGAALAGHDGRRGYLHHAAVHPDYRGKGIGRMLADACLEALQREGIHKSHLFVFRTNANAQAFWAHLGWQERVDLVLMSKTMN